MNNYSRFLPVCFFIAAAAFHPHLAHAQGTAQATSANGESVSVSTESGAKTVVPKSKKSKRAQAPVRKASRAAQQAPVEAAPAAKPAPAATHTADDQTPEPAPTDSTNSQTSAAHHEESQAPEMIQSELYHQAPAGTFEVTPGIAILSTKSKLRSTDLEINTVGVPLNVIGEYGVSSFFSIGLNLQFGNSFTSFANCPVGFDCKSSKSYGLEDPRIDLKFMFPVGPGLLRFGAGASFAVEKSVKKASGDSNTASGGNKVVPFLAYEVAFGPSILGAQIQYDAYIGDRKVSDSGVDQTDSKGAAFSTNVFYEYTRSIVTLGAALGYGTSERSQTTANGTTTINSVTTNAFALKIYAPIHTTDRLTLLPTVTYAILTYPSSSTAIVTAVTAIGGAARISF